MANNENLKPPSTSEARERGRKGGKKSGEVRRAKKTMKEMLDYNLRAGKHINIVEELDELESKPLVDYEYWKQVFEENDDE